MYPSPGPQGPSPVIPDDPPPADTNDRYDELVSKASTPPHGRLWVQLLLLALTFITTTMAGGCHYLSFLSDMSKAAPPAPPDESLSFWLLLFDPELWREIGSILGDPMFYVHGLWYSITILAILGSHEMGHYIACGRYGVIATRPFFLPVPPFPFMTGTLGAFIRIKSRIPNKIALFDIAIAGPIAGFVVAVPALFIGLALSRIDRLPADTSVLQELGEPLLFRFAAWTIFGDIAGGSTINIHPMAFAAWFGLLATALNLFPISQLDGGHISYAVFGRRSTIVTVVMVGVAIGLTWVSASWIVWTGLLVLMIFLLGPHHPPTLDDDIPLATGRLWLADFALAMFVLCFTPAPIGPFVGAP